MRYREILPPPSLVSCVQSLWEIRGTRRLEAPCVDRVLPDGCFDLVVHLGDLPRNDRVDARLAAKRRTWLAGVSLRAARVEFSGDVHVVGACLRPGSVGSLLGVPARELTDRTLPLAEVWGLRAESLEDRVRSGDADGALARLAEALSGPRPDRVIADPLSEQAVHRIRRAGGALSVQALARDLGVTRRRLERRFALQVGLTPKQFCRVTRFDEVARRGPEGMSWTQRALAHGYVDQAHLIDELRSFAGVTPLVFERERRSGDDGGGVANPQDVRLGPP